MFNFPEVKEDFIWWHDADTESSVRQAMELGAFSQQSADAMCLTLEVLKSMHEVVAAPSLPPPPSLRSGGGLISPQINQPQQALAFSSANAEEE